MSFSVPAFNQAGARVHVYRDGSVLVNHGGTEMGQGLNTKVAQVTATELGVDLACVRVTATDTSKVANRSEEHTSELQSLMRISYAVFCLKKKKNNTNETLTQTHKSHQNKHNSPN